MYKKIPSILILSILLIISFFAIKPLFVAGFFPIHDDTQIQRVFEMKKALADGMFPVRWVQDLGYGYGYPIFNFYAPLAYYIGGFFNLLGFDSLTSTKIMLGLAIILSGITMYLFAKEFWGKLGGLISGALYLFAPYHALNIYVRGDFAEVWAYVFIPLVFLGIYKISTVIPAITPNPSLIKKGNPLSVKGARGIFTHQSTKWIIISALSFAGVITSHNLTAMMITPFIILYALTLIFTTSRKNFSPFALRFTLFFILGLSLSAFYWLPTLTEMKYTNVLSVIGGGSDFRDHYVCPLQLWQSPWAFGGSSPDCISDGLSFRIGKVHIILAALSLLVLFLIRKNQKNHRTQIIFFLFLLLASVFFMLSISKPIWESIQQMSFFQYPWRFLLLASFAVSFLGGAFAFLIKKSKLNSIYFTIIAILAILLINAKLFNPQTITNTHPNEFTNTKYLNWTTSKTSDEYMPKNFTKPKNENEIPNSKFTIANDKAKITMQENKTQQFSALISTPQPSKLLINLAWFPAWHVYLNNSEVPFKKLNNSLELTIPKGENKITVKYISTPIETIANTLTLISFLSIITYLILTLRPKSS